MDRMTEIRERVAHTPTCGEVFDGTAWLALGSDNAALLAAVKAVGKLHQHAHKAVEPWATGYKFTGDHCAHDGDHWPCPTNAAIAAALEGEGEG